MYTKYDTFLFANIHKTRWTTYIKKHIIYIKFHNKSLNEVFILKAFIIAASGKGFYIREEEKGWQKKCKTSCSPINCRHRTKLVSNVKKCYGNTRPRGYKFFPCSTQLSMKFQMLTSLNISRNSAFFLTQISIECYFYVHKC